MQADGEGHSVFTQSCVHVHHSQVREILQEEEDLSEIVQLVGKVL